MKYEEEFKKVQDIFINSLSKLDFVFERGNTDLLVSTLDLNDLNVRIKLESESDGKTFAKLIPTYKIALEAGFLHNVEFSIRIPQKIYIDMKEKAFNNLLQQKTNILSEINSKIMKGDI